MSIGLSFGRSMGCDDTKTSVAFAFRWTGLEGRRLTSWAQRHRSLGYPDAAKQPEIVTAVAVPLEAPQSGITTYVEAAVKPLFALFGGMEIHTQVIEGAVRDVISQRF
jgi:hypothetical protein